MNVLVLFGSSRKKGNTARAVGWIKDELQKKGHQVERIDVARVKLGACQSCFKCMSSEGFSCVQKDDANAILAQMAAADVILWASPLYFWSFSAPLKLLIDRLICQVKGYGTSNHLSNLKGKAMGLLVTCWGPREDNSEGIVNMYRGIVGYGLARNRGHCVIPRCSPEGEMPSNAEQLARQFAGSLC
jgi:multimeric flavodoxin WrbA